jgi:hypothetical protein
VTRAWQSHDGAVVKTGGSASPSVGYDYDLAGRVCKPTYPGGREIYYNYAAANGLAGLPGQLADISTSADASGALAEYFCLGDGTIVKTTHPQVAGGLTLSYSTGSGTAGRDNVGRVIDQKWTNTGEVLDYLV